MTVVQHSPYSPDLAPSDLFLFPKLKINFKGRRFQTMEEIQAVTGPREHATRKMTSRNASDTGSAAGIVVKPQKGTILNVMPGPNV